MLKNNQVPSQQGLELAISLGQCDQEALTYIDLARSLILRRQLARSDEPTHAHQIDS